MCYVERKQLLLKNIKIINKLKFNFFVKSAFEISSGISLYKFCNKLITKLKIVIINIIYGNGP